MNAMQATVAAYIFSIALILGYAAVTFLRLVAARKRDAR
jgi:hypothetical protein